MVDRRTDICFYRVALLLKTENGEEEKIKIENNLNLYMSKEGRGDGLTNLNIIFITAIIM